MPVLALPTIQEVSSEDESEDNDLDMPGTAPIGAPSSRNTANSYRDLLPSGQILQPASGYNNSSVPFKTRTDSFKQYRIYPSGRPSYTPDAQFTLGHFSEAPTLESDTFPAPPLTDSDDTDEDFIDLFGDGGCTGLLLKWHYQKSSSVLSKDRTDSLVKDVILHPRFRAEDFRNFTMDKANTALDAYQNMGLNGSPIDNEWETHSVQISVPCDRMPQPSEAAAAKLTVDGIKIRPLMQTIRAAFAEPMAEFFHLSGYELWQDNPDGAVRQYDEIYTSNAFLEEQANLTAQVRAEGRDREVVVAALLVGSDSTRLAQFGTQSLWPIYLYFGNLSKYVRSKPSTFSAHHIAYIPKVTYFTSVSAWLSRLTGHQQIPDIIQEWYHKTFGVFATAETLAHLKRELFHAIWILLLDDELRKAYFHGEDMEFWDKVWRIVFPCFFTYSMDYLEK